MLEDDEDRAEPCVRTKTETSFARSKTGLWRKAGLVAIKVAARAVGQEATTFDDWLDEVIILTMTIDELYWKGSLRLNSQHRWMRYLAPRYDTVLELEDCTCSDHTGSIANTEPYLTALDHLGQSRAKYSPLTSPRYKRKQKLHANPSRECHLPARQAFISRGSSKKYPSTSCASQCVLSDTTKKRQKGQAGLILRDWANDQARERTNKP